MREADLPVGIPVVILLIGHIVLSIYLISLILLKRHLRDQTTHWFVLNTMVVHLLFSLIVRPENIEYEMHVGIAQSYCRIVFILEHVEQVMIPALLLMYTVDRMMYVRNPDTYGQKMTLGVVLTLLLLPWALSIIVGLVSAYGYQQDAMIDTDDVEPNTNSTTAWCTYSRYDSLFHTGMQIFEALLALLVALVSLIVTVLVVCFYFRYKRALQFSHAYSQLEAEVMTYVRDATVGVCVLNLLFLFVFLMNFLVIEFIATMWIEAGAVYFFFELLQAVVLLFVSTDIRQCTYKMCCKRKKSRGSGGGGGVDGEVEEPGEDTTLRYVNCAEAEEAQ